MKPAARCAARATGFALLVACAGCYSFATVGRARTVAKDHTEIVVAPGVLAVASGSGGSVRPIAMAAVRYGLTEDVELDGQLTTGGVTVGPRVQLVRSPAPDTGLDVLVAPAVAYTFSDKLAFELPVLLGWNFGEHQLVVAPRVVYQMRLGVGGQGAVSFLYAGASIGFALRVDPHVTFMPEVSALTEIYAEPGFSSNLARAVGLTGSLGLLFDL